MVAARIVYSLVHVAFEQTNAVTSVRFTFFFAQVVAMIGMSTIVLRHATCGSLGLPHVHAAVMPAHSPIGYSASG